MNGLLRLPGAVRQRGDGIDPQNDQVAVLADDGPFDVSRDLVALEAGQLASEVGVKVVELLASFLELFQHPCRSA